MKVQSASYSVPADLPSLTAVRLYLAIFVVLFHYTINGTVPFSDATGFFERSRMSVDMFFILSGFILTHVYLAAGRAPLDYPRFLMARAARIFPMHWFALSIVLVMVLAAQMMGRPVDPTFYDWKQFWLHLPLIQVWFPTGYTGEWNGPSWSLSAEWWAYCVFPMYAWIFMGLRQRPWALLALALVSMVACDALSWTVLGIMAPHAENGLALVRIAGTFLYGCALYAFLGRLPQGLKLARTVFAVLVVTIVLSMHFALDDRIIVLLAGPFVLSLAWMDRDSPPRPQTRLSRFFHFGGEASYALYLLHLPILMLWKQGFAIVLGLDPDRTFGLTETSLLLVVTLGLSALAYVWVEKPSRRILRGAGERWLAARRGRTGTAPAE